MRSRAERATTALSALSFGVLGWCAAHALTWWLLTHQHVIDGMTVTHQHGYLGPAAILAACVAAGALLAMFLVSWRSARTEQPPVRRRNLRQAAALSTMAYLAAELAERQLSGDHQLPGPVVLLIGGVIYTLAGVATSLLWRGSTEAVRRIAGRLAAPVPSFALPAPRAPRAPTATGLLHRQRWAFATAGRGPPAFPV